MKKMLYAFEILLSISLGIHAIVVIIIMTKSINSHGYLIVINIIELFDFINSCFFMIMFYEFLYTLKRVELQMNPLYDSSD